MSTPDDDWFTCPNCGEVVRGGALACPHCGADEQTGWSEQSDYDDLDLPDEAFGDTPHKSGQRDKKTALTAIALMVLIIGLLLLNNLWQ